MPYAVRGASTVLLLCCAVTAFAGSELRGLLLSDALRLLQRSGLHIVFTSEIVTPEMRVATEPRAQTPREQLDEILAPHGLEAVPGPGQVILVVRRHPAPRSTARQAAHAPALDDPPAETLPSTIGYTDSVTVQGSSLDNSGTSATLGTSVLTRGYDATDSEGLRLAQEMPRIVSADDSQVDFSVRGSPYRQIGVVIDGVSTQWLQHAIYGRRDIGSVSMFGGDALESATLRVGAYPQRYDDNLGAQLELTLREGSRTSSRVGASIGGQTAGFSAEGPIGVEGRGSWIAGFRNSYRPWPPGGEEQDNWFAFADAHGKLVYDLSSTQQISVTALGGRSRLGDLDEPLTTPADSGIDQAALVNVAWRWTAGPSTVFRQQLFGVGQDQSSTAQGGLLSAGNHNRAVGYRMQLLHRVWGGTVDVGSSVTRTSVTANVTPMQPDGSFDREHVKYLTDAAYINFSRTIGRMSMDVGGRVSDSTLIDHPAAVPWVLARWQVNPAWTINASAGGTRQLPDAETEGTTRLQPERATHVDIGIAETLPLGLRWQATLFRREERDVVRQPDIYGQFAGDVTLEPPSMDLARNALSGRAQGLEFVVNSVQPKRFSGWASYGWSRFRQTDTYTHESFWSDDDRAHTFSAVGMYRVGQQASVSAILRAASGMPIPGYFVLRDGMLFVGDHRNEVRLPTYARLDLRGKRTFFSSSHAITAYGDVLNVLNRPNEGLAVGSVQPATGEAVGFSHVLQRRSVAFGIAVNLSR
jgi:hypothetical protein